MYSAELPGQKVVWLLNDTFHGPVNADESLPLDVPFVHNSIVRGGRDGLPDTTVTRGTHREPKSLVGPTNTAPPWDPSGGNDYWYWNGDGIVDGGKLRVFEYMQEPAGREDDPHWNFQWVGTDIATFSTKTLEVKSVTPTYDDDGVGWGVDLMRCGGYTYIYGARSGEMHLARARVGHLVEDDWQFWTGDEWSSDSTASTAITTDVGSSYSVTPMNGQFVLTTSDAWLGRSVYVAVADSPTGPFTGRTNVFTAPEAGGDIYGPYNIAAHPALSEPGKLTISYNVNSENIQDLYADANNNRPRFLDITFATD